MGPGSDCAGHGADGVQYASQLRRPRCRYSTCAGLNQSPSHLDVGLRCLLACRGVHGLRIAHHMNEAGLHSRGVGEEGKRAAPMQACMPCRRSTTDLVFTTSTGFTHLVGGGNVLWGANSGRVKTQDRGTSILPNAGRQRTGALNCDSRVLSPVLGVAWPALPRRLRVGAV